MSEQLEDQSCKTPSLEEVSLKSELMKQKQEMIDCLQDELIKVRGNSPRENYAISIAGSTERGRERGNYQKFTTKSFRK